ncbi:ABC transporter ATP-binding protein [Desulfospira joergensenii]|uniref:ABC transporter ATP-binding protein n=1 Tax=Desulfospira joergensenii TaxID=53329 RepID=UPI0003B63115|nr:ABC transporter ATP-binding protein [Desulfospira joergensenii]
MSPVIETQNLVKEFKVGQGFWGSSSRKLRAVDQVSLQVDSGETLGLVGESGSGKSTVGNCILRLVPPTGGKVLFRGENILGMKENRFRSVLGKLQMVFQDPQSSLDPRMTVRKIVGYPLKIQQGIQGRDLTRRVSAVLQDVGLDSGHLDRYPHEFSGGQRQRIGIARALITGPEFVVFDEPTSALDVSVQAQILNLVVRLQEKYNYAYLFISHDLAVVRHISRRIAVMYLGRIVETAPKERFFSNPCHPYSTALIASVPRPDPFRRQTLSVLGGDVPSPMDLPKGCGFAPRCGRVMEQCREVPPPRVRVAEDHWVDCHLYG